MRVNLEGGWLGVLGKGLEEEEVGAPLMSSTFPGRGQGWGGRCLLRGVLGFGSEGCVLGWGVGMGINSQHPRGEGGPGELPLTSLLLSPL